MIDSFGSSGLQLTESSYTNFDLICLGAFTGNAFELTKVRMQQGEAHGYKNVFDAVTRIVREEGFFSLWRGTYPAAVRAALLTSSQLATYDQR